MTPINAIFATAAFFAALFAIMYLYIGILWLAEVIYDQTVGLLRKLWRRTFPDNPACK